MSRADKKIEQVVFSRIEEIQKMFSCSNPEQREFVIVVRGFEAKKSKNDDLLLNILLAEMSPRAPPLLLQVFSSPRRQLYQRAMKLKDLLDLES